MESILLIIHSCLHSQESLSFWFYPGLLSSRLELKTTISSRLILERERRRKEKSSFKCYTAKYIMIHDCCSILIIFSISSCLGI